MRAALTLASGAGAALLLIVCANLANLLIARGLDRANEVGVRSALGASQGRIIRQLATENALLAVVGGALGLALGTGLTAGIDRYVAANGTDWINVSVDGGVIVFTVGVCFLSTLLFGFLPAVGLARQGARSIAGTTGRSRATSAGLRSSLVVVEVAISTVLLVAAGLMVRSLVELRSVDPGFDPEASLTVTIRLPAANYRWLARADFVRATEESLATLPGVQAVGTSAMVPLAGTAFTSVIRSGQTPEEARGNPPVHFMPVSAGFFKAMGIPLQTGRLFEADDGQRDENGDLLGRPVAIVNRTMAERLWPGRDPVGLGFRTTGDEQDTIVVGVVGDVRQVSLRESSTLQMYVPFAQDPWRLMSFVLRTAGDPLALADGARAVIQQGDPELAIARVATLSDVLQQSLTTERLFTTQFWMIGAVALGLAAIGLYGLITHSISQRTREIGIRMALGARSASLVVMVTRQAVGLVALGLVLGLGAAVAGSRLLESQLFAVSALDPATYAGVAIALLAVAAIAAAAPARRAARVEPTQSLRSE